MNQVLINLTPNITQKYILAEVVANSETLLWGDPSCEWHKDIAATIEQAGYIVEVVKGGGRIKIDTKDKTIFVWGKSSVYGEADFREVKQILVHYYPEFQILNEVLVRE